MSVTDLGRRRWPTWPSTPPAPPPSWSGTGPSRGSSVADTKSSDVDVVTEADRAAEALIRDRIRAARPDDAFLGEEGDGEPGTSGVRWIIDPIDGTVNFLYGLPQYAVSIAAEVDGEVVAGVVIDVAKRRRVRRPPRPGRRRRAPRRRGRSGCAVRRRSPSGWSPPASATAPRCAPSRPAAVARLLPHDPRHPAAGVVRARPVPRRRGALDGYVEEGVNLWDHAAGGLIARAAGARSSRS